MHGLMRVQEKHVDDTLERDTRPKGEKQSRLTMSEQRCALVLLYNFGPFGYNGLFYSMRHFPEQCYRFKNKA